LIFHTAFPEEFELKFKDEVKTRRFSPTGWELLGIGDVSNKLEKCRDFSEKTEQYLFNTHNLFLLITVTSEAFGPSQPQSEYVTEQTAAEWCFDYCKKVPEHLIDYLPDRFITPPDIAKTDTIDASIQPSPELLKRQEDRRSLIRMIKALKFLIDAKDTDEFEFYISRFFRRARPICEQADEQYADLINSDVPLPHSVKVLCRISKWIESCDSCYGPVEYGSQIWRGIIEDAKEFDRLLTNCIGPDYSNTSGIIQSARDSLSLRNDVNHSANPRFNELLQIVECICNQICECETEFFSQLGEIGKFPRAYQIIRQEVSFWLDDFQNTISMDLDDAKTNQLISRANVIQLRFHKWLANHSQDSLEEAAARTATSAKTTYNNEAPENSEDVGDSRSPIQQRDDWLLEMRGLENTPRYTLERLSQMLIEKCKEMPEWVPIEATAITDALKRAYRRQTGKPWPFDGRGRRQASRR
jgi:hypothetical protein